MQCNKPRENHLLLNKLFTNLTSLSRTYWSSVATVYVRTSLRSIRTSTTSGQFLVFTHVTFALTTVAIRHVGAQTNALNREITVRTKA